MVVGRDLAQYLVVIDDGEYWRPRCHAGQSPVVGPATAPEAVT
jgi:hypothetical protein